MRILYLDTSSSFLYCGIIDNNNIFAEIKKELGKDLSTKTLYLIEKMFEEKNILTNSVDKIVVVNGPGSFTGVRIALTIAKTYAWSLRIPIITITSLEAMAVSSDSKKDFYIPMIDARRGYIYTGIYDNNYYPILKNQYLNLETLKLAVNKLGHSYTYISNDSFDISTEKYDPNILKIVQFFADKKSINPHEVNAEYLKMTEAEEKLNDK